MANDELIIACTLDPDLVRERIADWRALVDRSVAVERHDTGVRLRFDPASLRSDGVAVVDIATLIDAEHACCPFFSFTISLGGEGPALEVTAPPAARPLVDVLLGLEAVD